MPVPPQFPDVQTVQTWTKLIEFVQPVQTCTPACELAASVAKKGCFADVA